jgi:N-acetylneuraminic acid mutarotase
MRKGLALVLVLIFLTAICLMVDNPVSGASARVENSWVTKTPMHFTRANIGVAVVNGQIYAIGGDNGTEMGNVSPGTSITMQVVNVNEAYNPSSDTWVSAAPMPTARALFGTAVYQNKIYCIGGYSGKEVFIGPESWNYKGEYYDLGVNEVYDPSTNTWATKASLPTPRYSAATNIVNGKIYFIGGYTMANMGERGDGITQVYDPQTDSWATKSSAPLPVVSSASAVVDNNIYVLGMNQSKLY